MKVAFGSIFRSAEDYLERYIAQFNALVSLVPEHSFEPILVEGDSTDHTWERLNEAFPGRVFQRVHGGPAFGSTDCTERWMQISYACDGVLEQVKPEHDALIYVESDLLWEPAIMRKLLGWLEQVDAVSPMCMWSWQFYDTWGFSAQGQRFANLPPFHPMLVGQDNSGLLLLDTGGSCMAMRGQIARSCRFRPPTQAMIGFCKDMQRQGYSIWLDPSITVVHPHA